MRSNSLVQVKTSFLLNQPAWAWGHFSPLLLICSFLDHVQIGFIIEKRKKLKGKELKTCSELIFLFDVLFLALVFHSNVSKRCVLSYHLEYM